MLGRHCAKTHRYSTSVSTPLLLRDLATEPAPERFIPSVLPWVLEAWDPYLGWLLGERDVATRVERWMHRPSSEVAIGRVTVGELDDVVVGGYIALDGAELPTCRISDAVASLSEAGDEADALRSRMEASRELLEPVSPDDFYLSKLGVLPGDRGKGYGRRLLNLFIEEGSALGFHRFRLDVWAQNDRAIELYRLTGFQVVSMGKIPGTSLEYVAMSLGGGATQ
jgi:ribosomal protein S18 acetylase RimI-like enzyme